LPRLSKLFPGESEELTRPLSTKVLEAISKWGRNASPLKIAMLYYKLNKAGFKDLSDVSKRVSAAKDLQKYVAGLEGDARAFKKATAEQYNAEATLPTFPLQNDGKPGGWMVTAEELDYVEKYYNTAVMIADDAEAARHELDKAIAGWDAAVEQAKNTNDFTRAAAWEAINDLNKRFNNEGGDFRAYLVNARDQAARTEYFAREKQYHSAHILGKWTPPGYAPPAP
jgi:hypothetical protein